MKYAPIPRTCQRCGKKGNTDTIQATIIFDVDSEIFSTVHLKKWKNYCDSCEIEVKEIINAHMDNLDHTLLTFSNEKSSTSSPELSQ